MSVSNAEAPRLSLFRLAGPTIVGNLLLSMVHLAAIKIVAELGAEAVAAVIAADRIYMAIQLIIFSITAGTTTMVAYAWGARNLDEADRVVKLSAAACLAASLSLWVIIQWLATPLVAIFGLQGPMLAEAAQYLKVLIYFNVFFSFLAVISAALRAAGDALTPVWVAGIGNIVNVLLAYAFVYGIGPLPAMGIIGAAYAAGISYALVGGIFFLLWTRQRLLLKPVKQPYWEMTRLRKLIRIAVPAGIEQSVFNFSIIAFMWVVSLYGTEAFTAYGIGVNILSVSIVIGIGFSIATATMTGQNLGAGRPDLAEQAARRNLKISFAIMAVVGLVIGLNARLIGSFFINEPLVLDYLVGLTIMVAIVQPMMSIEFTLGGALRGAGDTRSPARIMFTGFLFGRVVLTALFFWLGLSVYWVYAALIADYIIKCCMYLVIFKRGNWKTAFGGN
ncbi:MATE family efflux transporter [Pseudohongiella sp. SYSU M77423]|uniref:MATE family efflux transporter n=1 Tax=Pseudohongiella sp. SYSU M77423 TaxID=3042312 RepID=UPI0024816A30|nr:MATE family efflux transporter [Pseudohongiella sp. SYSU M77423]MDH7942385.1 MATE family efflux transporter [Pseudohongiella sp. SYSU M77423]